MREGRGNDLNLHQDLQIVVEMKNQLIIDVPDLVRDHRKDSDVVVQNRKRKNRSLMQ